MVRLTRAWSAQARGLVSRLNRHRERWPDIPDLTPLFEAVELETRELMRSAMAGTVEAMRIGFGFVAQDVEGVRLREADIEVGFDVEAPEAVRYFVAHGAGRISKIDDVTRRYIRGVIREGLANGVSYQEVARQIVQRYREFSAPSPLLHIRSRAELIAVTEMGDAYAEGTMIAARQLRDVGLVMEKRTITAGDRRVEYSRCGANADQGWIPLDQPFQSGHDRPTYHPGCRCDVTYRRAPGSLPTPEAAPRRERRPRRPSAAPPPPPREEYPGFQLTEQATSWMEARYPHITWGTRGLDIDNVNPTFGMFHKLAGEFPEVAQRLKYVGTAGSNPVGNAYAHATRDGLEIVLNRTYYSDPNFVKHLVGDAASGWHTKGSGKVESVIAHEFGHHVENWIRREGASKAITKHVTMAGDGLILDTHSRVVGGTRSINTLSRYATKSREEAWAEAFEQRAISPRAEWHSATKKWDAWLKTLGNDSSKWLGKDQWDFLPQDMEARKAALAELRRTLKSVGLTVR